MPSFILRRSSGGSTLRGPDTLRGILKVAPVKVRIGAFGLLHGRGKTPIGRGF